MVQEVAVWRRDRRLFGGLLVERVISVWGRKEVAVFGESGRFWRIVVERDGFGMKWVFAFLYFFVFFMQVMRRFGGDFGIE